MGSRGGGAYNAGTAHVNILPNLTKFQAELRTKLKAMDVNYSVDVGADTAKFTSQVRAALKEVPTNIDVNLVANTKQADERLDHAARARTATVAVRADTGKANADIDRAVAKRDVVINVAADTSKARADIDTAVVKRRTTIGVDADTAKAEIQIARAARMRRVRLLFSADTTKATSALDRLLTNVRQLDRYQKRTAMMAAGYSLLGVAIAGVIGPLSSMVGTLAQASGMLATLPAMVGAALGGIAGLAIGLNGIGKAFTAAGASGGSAGRDMADAMEDAERAVTRAYRGIRDAERNVVMSHRDAKRAQEDLTKARKDAVDQLDDLNNRLNDAALNEEGAVLAVARAKQRLQETLRDNKASQLDIAEADHAYRSAVDSLNDLRVENSKLAEETKAANEAGVEGAEGVIAAKEGIEEADYQVLKATEALEEAHWALDDALESVADSFAGGSAGIDPFAEAMARLSPNAREFVLAMKALGPAWTDLRLATQDALFEGMGASVTTLAKRQLPVLKDGLVGINTALNTGIRASLAEFSSELAADDFGVFLTNATTGAQGLAGAFRPLSRMWMDLNVVGSEYLPRMGRAIEEVTTKWSHQINIARQTGDLNAIIDNGIQAWGRSMRGLRDVGGILMGTMGAASASSQPFMEGLSNSLSETNQWVNSFDGQSSIADFFGSATNALSAAMPVFQAVGGVIANGLLPAIESLVVGVGPGLTEFVTSFGTGLSNALPAIELAGEAAGGLLSDVANGIDAIQPVTNVVLGLVESFLSLPQPILTAMGLMVAAKWLKVPGIMGKAAESVTKLGEAFAPASEGMRLAGWMSRDTGREIGGLKGAALQAKGGLQTLGGYAKGAGTVALNGFKGAASGVMSLLGGPWNIALGVAMAAVTTFIDANARAKDAQNNINESVKDGKLAYGDLATAMAEADGALNADGIAAQARIVKGEMAELMELGGQMDGWFYSLDGVSEFMGNGEQGWWAATFDADVQRTAETIKQGTRDIEDVLKSMGHEVEDLDGIIAAGGPTYDTFIAQLKATSDEGSWAAQHVEQAREKIVRITDAYEQMNPQVLAAQGHFAVLADETADVTEKTEALHNALLELNGIDRTALEIQADVTRRINTIAAKTTNDADGTNEYTGVQLTDGGDIDMSSMQGVALNDTLLGLGEDMHELVAKGEATPEEAAARVEESLRRISEASGIVGAEWDNIVSKYTLTDHDFVVSAKVDGMDDVEGWLHAIDSKVAKSGKDVPVSENGIVNDMQKRHQMRMMGVGVNVVNTDTGEVNIHFEDEVAKEKYRWWVENAFPTFNLANPTAKANLDDTGLMLTAEAAEYQLIGLDLARPNPLASMDISELSDEAVKALEAVDLLDGQKPEPDAFLNLDQLNEDQLLAMSKVFDLDSEKPTPVADLEDADFNARHKGVKDKADKLDGRTLKTKVEVDTAEANEELDTFSAKWGAFVDRFKGWLGIGEDGIRKAASDVPSGYATGGKLPETGPGTQTVDGFLGVNDQGMPVARVNAGEWVINRASSKKHDRLLHDINNDTVNLPGYANGGIVESMERHVGALWPALTPGGKAYSTYRPGARGYHGSGQAADFSNTPNNDPTPEMQALAQHIYKYYKDQTLELIHWPLNGFRNIRNGQDADFGHQLNMEHRNHVHWALAKPLNPIPTSLDGLMKDVGFQGGITVTEEHNPPSDTGTDSADQLVDLRASDRSNPNAYGAGSKDGPNGGLPTTWTGMAEYLAKPIIEGHTNDLLKVLGVSNELPGFMKAYNLMQEDALAVSGGGGGVDARSNALRSLANGGEETDYLATDKVEVVTARMGVGGLGLSDMGMLAPKSGNFSAEQWRPMMIQAYRNQGYEPTPAKIDAWVRQIQSESGGDPNIAQQIVDINGTGEAAGVGLGQMIPGTWAAYRDPSLPDDRRDPWAMTNAMVRYGEQKYGAALLDVIGHGHGYATGGFVTGAGGPTDDMINAWLSNGEFVQNALTTSVSRPLQEAMNQSPAMAAQLNQLFTQGADRSYASAPASNTTIEYHIHAANADEGIRRAEMMERRRLASHGV